MKRPSYEPNANLKRSVALGAGALAALLLAHRQCPTQEDTSLPQPSPTPVANETATPNQGRTESDPTPRFTEPQAPLVTLEENEDGSIDLTRGLLGPLHDCVATGSAFFGTQIQGPSRMTFFTGAFSGSPPVGVDDPSRVLSVLHAMSPESYPPETGEGPVTLTLTYGKKELKYKIEPSNVTGAEGTLSDVCHTIRDRLSRTTPPDPESFCGNLEDEACDAFLQKEIQDGSHGYFRRQSMLALESAFEEADISFQATAPMLFEVPLQGGGAIHIESKVARSYLPGETIGVDEGVFVYTYSIEVFGREYGLSWGASTPQAVIERMQEIQHELGEDDEPETQ